MEEEVLERKVLFVGCDDSNHAGDRKGDIIVAAFSPHREDGIVQKHRKCDEYSEAGKWLKGAGRDFRFTIIHEEDLRRLQPNIPYAVPSLVTSFLNPGEKPQAIKVFLDGILKSDPKKYLREALAPLSDTIVIGNFPKIRGIHICPTVVYMAHLIAHNLYIDSFSNLTEHSKFVPISEKEVLNLVYAQHGKK